MEKVLDNLYSLLAVVMMAGCTASLSSLGIGPLVFIIVAIIRLVSKSLGGWAKLCDTVLAASMLGAIVHIVSTYAITFLAQQIYGGGLLYHGVLPASVVVLMAAGHVLITGLTVGAFVAYRCRGYDVSTAPTAVLATCVALGATYVALGFEGWFYLKVIGDPQDAEEIGGGLTFFCSSGRLIVAGLGAILFSFLISFLTGRRHHE